MLYHPPTGSTDPNAPYVGKNVAAGIQGSKVPPGAVEMAQRELVNLITQSGQTPTDSDLTQVTRAVRGGQLDFDATDTGTADAVSCQIGLPHTQVKAGMPFTFIKGANPNATTTPTLTITDLAGLNGVSGPLIRANGKALAPADLPGGALVTVRADTQGAFRVTSVVASDIALICGANGALISGADTGTATGIVIATPLPAVTALRPWMVLVTTPANVNTGALSIYLANLGAKPVIYPNGSAFLGGEMQPRPQIFVYDGTSWEWQGQQTPVLQQATTFYCSPGGSDTNNGLTAATPLRTIQAAVNRTALFNLNGFNVTIKLADGGYAGPVTLPAISGSGSITILGNPTTPGNIILNSNTQGFVGVGAGSYTINGLRVITIGNSFQMGAGQTWTLQNIDYGPCSASHISIDGGALFATGQHNISGSAQAHVSGINGASLRSIPGAYPTLNVLFGVSFPGGFIVSNTFSDLSLIYGSITGAANVTNTKRFVTATGIINTLGRGINYYPGDTPGTSVKSWEYQ